MSELRFGCGVPGVVVGPGQREKKNNLGSLRRGVWQVTLWGAYRRAAQGPYRIPVKGLCGLQGLIGVEAGVKETDTN